MLSAAWACDRSLAGIAVSNPAGGMDVSVLQMYVPCVLGQRSRNKPEECCVLLGPGGQDPPEAAAAAAETKSASVHAPLLRRIRLTELTLGMELGSHILCAKS
jgi:hypothetical protein